MICLTINVLLKGDLLGCKRKPFKRHKATFQLVKGYLVENGEVGN